MDLQTAISDIVDSSKSHLAHTLPVVTFCIRLPTLSCIWKSPGVKPLESRVDLPTYRNLILRALTADAVCSLQATVAKKTDNKTSTSSYPI